MILPDSLIYLLFDNNNIKTWFLKMIPFFLPPHLPNSGKVNMGAFVCLNVTKTKQKILTPTPLRRDLNELSHTVYVMTFE